MLTGTDSFVLLPASAVLPFGCSVLPASLSNQDGNKYKYMNGR